jgi:catechol 2,3-dioxygenase-like lactoylglutathione lyase family enzyme
MEEPMSLAPQEPSKTAPSAPAIDTKIEVVIIPVSDVERAKHFYMSLGWRLDADFARGEDWRVLQLTPPGSPCSVMIGKGLTDATPGSVQGTFLVVDDIHAARAALVAQGVAVSEVFHFDGTLSVVGTQGRLPGPAPERRSYSSWVTFSDPDGNSWMVQEVTSRLPGRGHSNFDVPTLRALLQEAETAHRSYERSAPKHHWSDWYSAYIVARQSGLGPEPAAEEGARHIRAIS